MSLGSARSISAGPERFGKSCSAAVARAAVRRSIESVDNDAMAIVILVFCAGQASRARGKFGVHSRPKKFWRQE